jgi:hypothetical protein
MRTPRAKPDSIFHDSGFQHRTTSEIHLREIMMLCLRFRDAAHFCFKSAIRLREVGGVA